jgi:hypothetical protein
MLVRAQILAEGWTRDDNRGRKGDTFSSPGKAVGLQQLRCVTLMTSNDGKLPKLLAADMWAVFTFGHPNDRYHTFLNEGRPSIKRLIESIILYPEIVIPTEDFISLAILVGSLGERSVIHLLEAGVLRFVRIKGSIAYIGNGGGLKSYEIRNSERLPTPHCAPLDASISWALQGLKERSKDPLLPKLVQDTSIEISVPDFADRIRHETYMDVLNSQKLRSVFAIRNTHLDHLAGIRPNEVRGYAGRGSEWSKDEISTILALANTNMELYIAEAVHALDLSTSNPVGQIIKAKAQRAFGKTAASAFADLREISDMPDIGETVLGDEASLDEVLRLVHSRNGEAFRKWFHENCRTDPLGVSREYARLLKEMPYIQSRPVKILRFVVTAALGMVPIAGIVASAIDSFFLEGWLRGSSPKFFIEDLSQLSGRKRGKA